MDALHLLVCAAGAAWIALLLVTVVLLPQVRLNLRVDVSVSNSPVLAGARNTTGVARPRVPGTQAGGVNYAHCYRGANRGMAAPRAAPAGG